MAPHWATSEGHPSNWLRLVVEIARRGRSRAAIMVAGGPHGRLFCAPSTGRGRAPPKTAWAPSPGLDADTVPRARAGDWHR